MSRIDLKYFNERWARIYQRNQFVGYSLAPPLHMSDFLGNGKYAGLRPEFKRALFLEVVEAINAHKLYSLSIAMSQVDFAAELGPDVRKMLIGPYAFAFFSVVLAHQYLSERHAQGPFKAAYLVDRGFGHYEQLVDAHRVIVEFERELGGFRHTGTIGEDSDDRVCPLQAADAIAWASRKMELARSVPAGAVPEGFEPLAAAVAEDNRHVTIPIDREGIRMLSKPINNYRSKNGAMPKLTDIIVRNVGGGLVAKLRS